MDNRLDAFSVAEPQAEYNARVRIEKIILNNYRFFAGEFELNFSGENILIYGENGSGKSSIFKALELLTKKSITEDEFIKNKNIFSDEDASVEIQFSNKQSYIIDADTQEIPDYLDFLQGLSILQPTLDYKKILKVHYDTNNDMEQINLYNLFRILLNDYEYEKGKTLASIKNPNKYFEELTKAMNYKIIDNVNEYLNKYFESNCIISSFICKSKFDKNRNFAIPVINLKIDYRENEITSYHNFLNEARLSSLGISIYLSTIKTLYGALNDNSLKMLILDDLLISLDMNNRQKLLNLLKGEFSDFQTIFFTHDKNLFEVYKNQLDWKKYELYLDDSADIPSIIVKTGNNDLEKAKEFYVIKDIEACGLHLRKALEKYLRSISQVIYKEIKTVILLI